MDFIVGSPDYMGYVNVLNSGLVVLRRQDGKQIPGCGACNCQ